MRPALCFEAMLDAVHNVGAASIGLDKIGDHVDQLRDHAERARVVAFNPSALDQPPAFVIEPQLQVAEVLTANRCLPDTSRPSQQ